MLMLLLLLLVCGGGGGSGGNAGSGGCDGMVWWWSVGLWLFADDGVWRVGEAQWRTVYRDWDLMWACIRRGQGVCVCAGDKGGWLWAGVMWVGWSGGEW